MSGGGGGRTDVGSGEGFPDECSSVDVETPLNSPKAAVVKSIQKGDVLEVDVIETPSKKKSLVAKDKNGQVAGSLTPPIFLTLISCIEKGYEYIAIVLAPPDGGDVRVRILPKV